MTSPNEVTDDEVQRAVDGSHAVCTPMSHSAMRMVLENFAQSRTSATSKPDPSCGIKEGETMAQSAEGWAQWCEVRGNQMLANFLRKQAVDAEHAKLYRWLRQQHWDSSVMCVVYLPKANVLLGAHCPSGSQLDELVRSETEKERP